MKTSFELLFQENERVFADATQFSPTDLAQPWRAMAQQAQKRDVFATQSTSFAAPAITRQCASELCRAGSIKTAATVTPITINFTAPASLGI